MGMLSDFTVDSFLDNLAERSPTPGGGAVAAQTGALACAMARMVAAYSIQKRTPPDKQQRITTHAEQLERADQMLRMLVDEDAAAYGKLSEVMKHRESEPKEYQAALEIAVSVPMEIAAVACGALSAMAELQPDASRFLLSDLGVAAVTAEAAVRSAAFSVRVNTVELASENRRETLQNQLTGLESHAEKLRSDIITNLPETLQQ